MGFLKLMVLLALITTLKAKSINWGENIAQETATMNIKHTELEPAIREINRALLPMSERLNNTENDQNYGNNAIAVASRFSIFPKKKKDNAETVKQEYAFYRLQFLVQIIFKNVIDAIVEIIRRGNDFGQLAFINILVHIGVVFGYGSGVAIYFGFKSFQIISRIIRSPLNLFKPLNNGIQNILNKFFPNIFDYVKKLLVQLCNRGLDYIARNIKKNFEFDYVK